MRIRLKVTEPIKTGMWFTISNLIVKGVVVLSAPIFTRLMTSYEYGLQAQYISSEQILLIFMTLDLSYGAYNKALYKWETDKVFTTKLAQFFVTFLSLGVILLLQMVYPFVENVVVIPQNFLWWFFLYAITLQSYRNWFVRKQKKFDYKPIVASSLIYGLSIIIIPLLVVIFYKRSADAKYMSGLITSILFCTPFYIRNLDIRAIFNNISKTIDRVRFFITMEIPLAIHAMSIIILGQADRIMIGRMVGNAEAAYYTVAYTIASAVLILQNSIQQALIPWMFKQFQENKHEKVKSTTNVIFFLSAGVNILFIIVAPEIFKLLFTKEYYPAVYNIPPVACGAFFCFLYQVFSQVEVFYERTKYIMYVSIVCSILNVILNYILIPSCGYLICGYTTLFSYVCFAGGHFYFLQRIKKEEGIKSLFDNKFIILLGVVMLVCMVLTTLMYSSIVIRYAFVAIVLVVAAFKRKKIFEIIRAIKMEE